MALQAMSMWPRSDHLGAVNISMCVVRLRSCGNAPDASLLLRIFAAQISASASGVDIPAARRQRW